MVRGITLNRVSAVLVTPKHLRYCPYLKARLRMLEQHLILAKADLRCVSLLLKKVSRPGLSCAGRGHNDPFIFHPFDCAHVAGS